MSRRKATSSGDSRPLEADTSPIRTYSISQVEATSGFSRSTIHYYLKARLLPPVQKGARGPGFYEEKHLRRLARIRAMKEEGLKLQAIRDRLTAAPDDVPEQEVDLLARQNEEIRRLIIHNATREFAAKGYAGTRLADIVAATNISTVTLYRHFPSKRELFVEVVENLVESEVAYTESHVGDEADFVKRHLIRVRSFLRVGSVTGEMLQFLRAEALGTKDDTRELAIKAYRILTEPIAEDLRKLRRPDSAIPATSDEMMAYVLMGGGEGSVLQLQSRHQPSVEEQLLAGLESYLAIRAMYLGCMPTSGEYEMYRSYLKELIASPLFKE